MHGKTTPDSFRGQLCRFSNDMDMPDGTAHSIRTTESANHRARHAWRISAVWRSSILRAVFGLVLLASGIAMVGHGILWNIPVFQGEYVRPPSVPVRDLLSVERRPGEGDLAFVERATQTVHRAFGYCPGQVSTRYMWLYTGAMSIARITPKSILTSLSLPRSLRQVPFNFGLISADLIGFFDCGLCHQHDALLREVLAKAGIHSDLLTLRNHVVLRVSIDGEFWYADPLYGVGPIQVDFRDAGAARATLVEAYRDNPLLVGIERLEPDVMADRYLAIESHRLWGADLLAFMRVAQKVLLIAQKIIELAVAVIGSVLLVGAFRKPG